MQTELQVMCTSPEGYDLNLKIVASDPSEKIFDLLKQARAALVAQGCTPRPVKYGNGNGNGNGHSVAPHPAETAAPSKLAITPAQDTAQPAEAQPEPAQADAPKPEQNASPDKATPPATRPAGYRTTPKRQA